MGGGSLRPNSWLDGGGLAGDRPDVHPADAEVVQLALGQAHQLIVGLPVLPPVAVGPDEGVGHFRYLSRLALQSFTRQQFLFAGMNLIAAPRSVQGENRMAALHLLQSSINFS